MRRIIHIIIIVFVCKLGFTQNDTLNIITEYKTFYYPNGNISSEGYLMHNKPIGFWKSYYVTGIKKAEGKWTNNKLDSIWGFYDQLGDTIEIINYYYGKKNGFNYKYYKTSGNKNKIYSKELYVDGQRNDLAYYYHESGKLKKIIPYLNNKRLGIGFEYNKVGKLITITRYRNNEIIVQENINRLNSEGKKEGIWKVFYKNGNIKEEKNYHHGKLHGYYKVYNKEGVLLDAIKYKNGEVNLNSNNIETDIEIKEEYDDNGNLIFQGSYKNNIPIGVHRKYNEKGAVVKSTTYNILGNIIAEGIALENGKENGSWIYYYEGNNKKAEGNYNNGKKNGVWKYYYPNGKIKQKGSYLQEKLTGAWHWYYITGELLREEYYIYGQLDGEVLEYSEQDNIIANGNYIKGYKEGEWNYWIGDQKLLGNYVMDLKDGTWKSYYVEEEILSYEGRYVQGTSDGKHIYYYPNGSIKEEQYYSDGEKVKSWSKYDEYGDLIIVVQYKEGNIFKINGVKVKLNNEEI